MVERPYKFSQLSDYEERKVIWYSRDLRSSISKAIEVNRRKEKLLGGTKFSGLWDYEERKAIWCSRDLRSSISKAIEVQRKVKGPL